MFGTITLIAETVTSDAIGQQITEESTADVLAQIESITQSEYFAAKNANLNPEYRFKVFSGDYLGERLCEYDGKRYAIYRTYERGDYVELYAERKAGAL